MAYTLSTIKDTLETTNEIILDCIAYADKMKDTVTYKLTEKEIIENKMSEEKIRTGNFSYIDSILASFLQDLGRLHQIIDDLATPSVLIPALDTIILKYSKEADEIKSNFISYDYKLDMFFSASNYTELCDKRELSDYLDTIKYIVEGMTGNVNRCTYLDRSVSEVNFDDNLSDAIIDYLIGRGTPAENVENSKEQILNTIKDLYSSVMVLINPNNTDVLSGVRLYEKIQRSLDVVNQNLTTMIND